MLCFAFSFLFFNPCPDVCNDFVFAQVWHLVTAQDLQLLPWREKLPAEDSRGETTNRRPTKIDGLQLQRGSFGRVGLQAALLYKFGHTHKQNWKKLATKHCESQVNNEDEQAQHQTSSKNGSSFSAGIVRLLWFVSQPVQMADKPHKPLGYFLWNRNGSRDYTFQTYTLTTQQNLSTVYMCFSVAASQESGLWFQNGSKWVFTVRSSPWCPTSR